MWNCRPAFNVGASLFCYLRVKIICKVIQGMERFCAKSEVTWGDCVRQVNGWTGKAEDLKLERWITTTTKWSISALLVIHSLTSPVYLKQSSIDFCQIIVLSFLRCICHLDIFITCPYTTLNMRSTKAQILSCSSLYPQISEWYLSPK